MSAQNSQKSAQNLNIWTQNLQNKHFFKIFFAQFDKVLLKPFMFLLQQFQRINMKVYYDRAKNPF